MSVWKRWHLPVAFLLLQPSTNMAMQMKQTLSLFVLLLSFLNGYAQDEETAVALGEASVTGAKVVSRADGMTVYLTEAQKQASTNGYTLLQKLSLPNLRIDPVQHTVQAADNRGGVVVKINGIQAGIHELLMLDPQLVSKIEYVDTPGLRYADGTAYVIHIVARRRYSGYTIGTYLSACATSQQGNGTVFGKGWMGRSELSASYGFSGNRSEGALSNQTADYTLTDGTVYTIKRDDMESLSQSRQHNMRVAYNLTDSTAFVFQAALSGTLGNTPHNNRLTAITDGTRNYVSTSRDSSRFRTPVVDLYLFRQLTPRQSLTVNAVGTYIKTQSGHYDNKATVYHYDVNGQTASLLSEAVYENRLEAFTLSAGLNFRYKRTRNEYGGDASALTRTSQNDLYAFGEIKGAFKGLRYVLGTGYKRLHYRQNGHHYDFHSFRPKLTLACHITPTAQVRYSFQMQDRASRIAMTSEAVIRTNSMESTVGNPDLKPSHDLEHTLGLSHNTSRWQTSVRVYFKQCLKPNMALYERTADNQFRYTQTNQKEIDLLHLMAYAAYWLLPEKLQVAAYGGMQRCFNYGHDNTHCYTSGFYAGSLTAYLGPFSLQAYTDSGSRWFEGEAKGNSSAVTSFTASYTHKGWQVSLLWHNPFVRNLKTSSGEVFNCNLHKLTTDYNRDLGNRLILNISWKLSKGKKRQTADKTIHLKDTEDGIIK